MPSRGRPRPIPTTDRPRTTGCPQTGPSSLGLQPLDELLDLLEHLAALLHLGLDAVDGVDHGGVIATSDLLGDVRKAQGGELAEQVNSHVALRGQLAGACRSGSLETTNVWRDTSE